MCVTKRCHEARGEIVLAARQRCGAPLARGPVTRRRVEQRELEPMLLQVFRDLPRRHVVGKRAFDGTETRVRRFSEAFEKRNFVEQERHVRGKPWHCKAPSPLCSVRMVLAQLRRLVSSPVGYSFNKVCTAKPQCAICNSGVLRRRASSRSLRLCACVPFRTLLLPRFGPLSGVLA